MIHAEKQRLRARMREMAASRGVGDSTPITEGLQALDAWKRSSSVLFYAPMAGEADPTALTGLQGGRSSLFPRIEGERLGIYRMHAGSRWISGPFGLKEPDPESWELCSPADVDLALVPGLAFDDTGRRLGRGRGYYDRLLGHSGFGGFKIGLAWEWQLVPEIPAERHDIRMDLVIAGGKLFGLGSKLDKQGERE